MVFIVFDVGIAAQGNAGERTLPELHFAVEKLLAQRAGQFDVAVHAALGHGAVDFGRIEVFTGQIQVERLVFKQFQGTGRLGFTTVFRQDLRALQVNSLLAAGGIGTEQYLAVADGFAEREIPQGLRIAVTAAQLDFAVERIRIFLRKYIAQHNIVRFGIQIQRLLGGIGAAAEADTAFFQQCRIGFQNFQHAVFINGEIRQQAAHRNAALIGCRRLVVGQINRAFQRQTGSGRRHHGGIEIQIGFRRTGNKSLWIQSIAFDGNMTDDFI